MPTRAAAQLLLALCFAARAGAQGTTLGADSAKVKPDGWMIGFALGVPGIGTEPMLMLATAGASFTQLRPNHIGGDVSVGTMPFLVSYGVLPMGLRLGVALPVSVAPHVLLIPSTGMSFIGVAGPGGAGGLAGVNAGASTVFYVEQIGLKTSATYHGFANMRGAVWLFELGFVTLPAGLP